MSETPVGPPSPGPPPLHEPEPVPTWSRDFLRVLGIAFFGAVAFTFFVWLASTGLLRAKGSWHDTVEADPIWAGICAGMIVCLFPFLFAELKRFDSGFRRKGLIPLVVLSALCGGAIVTAVMMTWPFFLGDQAIPGTVSADLAGDPASVLLLLLFSISGMSWCLSIVMPMVLGGFRYALGLLVPYLGMMFVFPFAGIRIFENPASGTATIIWVIVALSGMAVLTVLAAMRNVIDKTQVPMSAAERDESYQWYMEDRRRRGLTNDSPLPGIDVRQQPQRPQYPPQR